MITLKVYTPDQRFLDITQKVKKVTWSGDKQSVARKLEFSIISNKDDKDIDKAKIQEGCAVYFWEDKKELFRGFIYSTTRKNDEIDYLVYDHAQKLVDIKVSYNFKDLTAKQIAIHAFKDYNIPYNYIIDDKVKYTKMFLGKTMADTIMSAYTHSHYDNGVDYMMYSKKGKINITKKGEIKLDLEFEKGKNIISSSYKSSIEKMVNKVLIVNKYGQVQSSVKSDDKLIKMYGLFQDVYKDDGKKDSKKEAKKKLKGREKTVTLEGFGDNTCITGRAVTIKDATTNLKGLFYIDSDTHTWENGQYKISLDLNFKNIMNTVSAGEDEPEETTNTTGTDGLGGKVLIGKKVKAEFTAYYPANNSMEGGFKDAMGNRLNPAKHTCAAPSCIPFNTKIQVFGTNTKCDGVTYKVTDRGGAIVVRNGIYHIDILMSNARKANNFGRRKGYIIIGSGKGYKTVENEKSNSAKANKALQLALSKVGGRYVLGTQGPNTFDCSGLMWWVYKHVGISLPRTSYEQSRHGKLISKANLQSGDLCFFATEGGRRVTHVGMYIGNNKFVHASSPRSGIKISKFTDRGNFGTYNNELVCCRRVV